MKVRELIRVKERDGSYLTRTQGSHRHQGHPRKPGLATVAGKLSVDIPIGTLISVLKQAGLRD